MNTQRVNITLPKSTLSLVDRLTNKGDRSSFIAKAVEYFAEEKAKKNLEHRLIKGYIANREESLQIAKEWFPLAEEAWQIWEKQNSKKQKKIK